MDTTAEADVADKWNRNADQWTNDVRSGYDTYRDLFTLPAFQAFLPPMGGLKVIDFGCGEGSTTRRLAEMGARMTASICRNAWSSMPARRNQKPRSA